MKRLTINKEISTKWLTRELQIAGVNVTSVGRDESGAYADIAEADEAAALVVIAAHNPESNPDILELADLQTLAADITNELAWLTTARTDIATARTDIASGIVILDSGATLAQTRAVVKGLAQIVDKLAQIVDRIDLEQSRELKAWRYVVRRLK